MRSNANNAESAGSSGRSPAWVRIRCSVHHSFRSRAPAGARSLFGELTMTLSERLLEYVRACFTGIWIESHEHQDALTEIAQLCRQEQWRLASWDIAQGLVLVGSAETVEPGGQDPLAALRALNAMASPEGTAVLVLQNFHRFLHSAEIVQAILRQIVAGKHNRTFVVVLAPIIQIPLELEKLFVCIEHEMPSREQLEQIARSIATEENELPNGAALERLLEA